MIDKLHPCRQDVVLIELPERVNTTSDGFAVYSHMNDSLKMHPKYGTVLAVHEDEKELTVGDTVYMSYLVLQSAITQAHEGLYIREDKRAAVLTMKENLFFIKRGEEIIPMNGFSLIKPIKNAATTYRGFKLAEAKETVSAIEGIVRVTGSHDVSAGDLVLIEDLANAPLEYSLTATLEQLYRTRDTEIVGKLSEPLKLNS